MGRIIAETLRSGSNATNARALKRSMGEVPSASKRRRTTAKGRVDTSEETLPGDESGSAPRSVQSGRSQAGSGLRKTKRQAVVSAAPHDAWIPVFTKPTSSRGTGALVRAAIAAQKAPREASRLPGSATASAQVALRTATTLKE